MAKALLDLLIDFLEDCPTVTNVRARSDWQQLSPGQKELADELKKFGNGWQKKALALQREIRNDLRGILAPPVKFARPQSLAPDWVSSSTDLNLWKLVRKLNKIVPRSTFQTIRRRREQIVFSLDSIRDSSAAQAPAKRKRAVYTPLQYTTLQFAGNTYELREQTERHPGYGLWAWYYLIIHHLLKTGELSRLRLCPTCDRIFVCASLKAGFCNDECRWKFNNQKRLKDGTFKKYRAKRKQREERRRLRA